MNSGNLVTIALFIVIAIPAVNLVAKPHRWKVLLTICLLFNLFLLREKLIVVLLMASFLYLLGPLIQERKFPVWLCVVVLLVPLVILRVTTEGSHFSNFQSLFLADVYEERWYSIFQIAGLSYFTFNSISYLVDVRRQFLLPEKNFFLLLLYLVYLPTQFSGPLHRAKYLLTEFRNLEVTDQSISSGLRLILWGLFKNLVIAQRLYLLLRSLMASEISGVYYLLVGLLFFLFLYCSFSSFIDLFQGVSAIFGIRLKQNFSNRIYLASSRKEFWRGWHITLNEWFRDYFFFTITRYDRKRRFTNVHLLATFILIGLWHEFSLALVLWGLMNGLWVIIESNVSFGKWEHQRLQQWLGVVYHLSISSVLALIFIAPNPLETFQNLVATPPRFPVDLLIDNGVKILIIVACWTIMDYHYAHAGSLRVDDYLQGKPTPIRWFIYLKLAVLIMVFGMSNGVDNYYNQFF